MIDGLNLGLRKKVMNDLFCKWILKALKPSEFNLKTPLR
jgi:hypothetical protein